MNSGLPSLDFHQQYQSHLVLKNEDQSPISIKTNKDGIKSKSKTTVNNEKS